MGFVTPGEKLKELREKLKITQQQLNEAGISRNFISMFEGNKRKLSKKTAEKIIAILRGVADNRGINIASELEYLYLSREEAAELYCREKLNKPQGNLSLAEMDEVIGISREYNFYDKLYSSYFIKANILYDSYDYKTAFDCYHDALEISLRYLYQENLCIIYNKLGKCRLNLLNYDEAVIFFERAYKYSISTGDIECRRFALFNMALASKNLGETDRAITSLDEFLLLSEKEGNYNNAVLLKANCFIINGDFSAALELYGWLEKSISDKSDPLLGYVYNNIAVLYSNMNKFEDSLAYFKKAEDVRSSVDPNHIAHTFLEKAEAFIKEALYKEAAELLEKCISTAAEYNDTSCIVKAYIQLENIYSICGEQDKLEEIYLKESDIYKYLGKREELIKVFAKLALLNIKKGNLESAEEYAARAVNA